ncbi:hypothetical protein BH20ACT15_BH20ACT15_04380 [soil metagenome]
MTSLYALLGIDGGALGLVLNLLVLFMIVVYLALIYWTYLDAKRRIEDPVLIACATAASVFPFVGTVVYTILRPPEFLEDRDERELELRGAELRLRQLIEQSCPHCEYPIERNYLRCPNCERRLRNPCRKCRKPLDPKWGTCPYCETEVRRQRDSSGEGRDRRRDRSGRSDRGPRSSSSRPDRPNRSDRTKRPDRPVRTDGEPSSRPFGTTSSASRSDRPGGDVSRPTR